eukprot:CAMPEP_0197737970 /NCGR_PEP_ID=MMETSP1435-20131217/11909_1 /TAXON_ID=426625 /ORGANISM="Chaetoceros brevis, Strain CCMP164" /LENGTH=94 /DNA_ID=CAMNT_0043326677 /DNA_START=5 /DNA_END=289 /DNA_ORIENTATION=+
MVFARSRPALVRYDVSSHMVKWWKGHSPTNGQVTKSLSPYEQAAVVPWLKTFPKRAYEKFTDAGMYWVPTGVATVGIVIATDEADAAQDRSHRY